MRNLLRLLLAVSVASLSAIPHINHHKSHVESLQLTGEYAGSMAEGRWTAVNQRRVAAWQEVQITVGRVAASQEVQITLALKLEETGVKQLQRHFLACSNPRDKDYAQHWTRVTLARIVTVEPQAARAVEEWLQQRQLRVLEDDEFPGGRANGFLRVRAPAFAIEHAFGVELWKYAWESTGFSVMEKARHAEIVRVSPAEHARLVAQNALHPQGREGSAGVVPPALLPHVDFVHGLLEFPLTTLSATPAPVFAGSAAKPRQSDEGAPSASSVTPQVIRQLYGLENASALLGPPPSKGSQGAAGFQHQSFSPTDLGRFQRRHNLRPAAVRKVHGKNSGWGHIEGNLDVEYLLAMADVASVPPETAESKGAKNQTRIPQNSGAPRSPPASPPIPTDYWLSSDPPFGMGFDMVGWAAALIADPDAALVWSVSYGEALGAVTPSYARRLDTEMQKLGVLGLSVLFASGDSGVYSRGGGFREFQPSFPACLPSVVAVGATKRNASGDEDEGVDWSGGGFSSGGVFDRARDAPWQVEAVDAYLSAAAGKLPPGGVWDARGRGFPDIAAVGVGYEVVVQGFNLRVSGTSASCPVVAGITALLNEARLRAGKAPLGFMAPFLYHVGATRPAAFVDIVKGNNGMGSGAGFDAMKGWDPVTGWGAPKFEVLLNEALALP